MGTTGYTINCAWCVRPYIFENVICLWMLDKVDSGVDNDVKCHFFELFTYLYLAISAVRFNAVLCEEIEAAFSYLA